jgi:hypothetical protein
LGEDQVLYSLTRLSHSANRPEKITLPMDFFDSTTYLLSEIECKAQRFVGSMVEQYEVLAMLKGLQNGFAIRTI